MATRTGRTARLPAQLLSRCGPQRPGAAFSSQGWRSANACAIFVPVQFKATKAKVAAAQPLAPSNAANVQGGKALEEIYQKKSQLEHIL